MEYLTRSVPIRNFQQLTIIILRLLIISLRIQGAQKKKHPVWEILLPYENLIYSFFTSLKIAHEGIITDDLLLYWFIWLNKNLNLKIQNTNWKFATKIWYNNKIPDRGYFFSGHPVYILLWGIIDWNWHLHNFLITTQWWATIIVFNKLQTKLAKLGHGRNPKTGHGRKNFHGLYFKRK